MGAVVRYFGYFVYLFILWIYARRNPRQVTVKERIGDKTVTRYNWFFALVAVAPLIILAGSRWLGFGDTGLYRRFFSEAPSSLSQIPSYIVDVNKDRGFYFFTAIIKCLISSDERIYFYIIAAFQGLAVIYLLRKYSNNMLLSLFIFVAGNDFLSYMENGIRQFVAVCIILLASSFIFEKKYIRAVIAVLVASLFHQSALLMLPIVFIAQGQPWNKSTTFMLLGSLFAVAFTSQFTSILENMLEDTQYSDIVNTWTAWDTGGTNPIRVAVFCVPALLSLMGLTYIREENDPVINVCTNMAAMSAGLYIISMATSGIYMGRLPIYVNVYSTCIILPWEIERMFNKQSSSFIVRAMIISFLLFYYYQIHYAWGAF